LSNMHYNIYWSEYKKKCIYYSSTMDIDA